MNTKILVAVELKDGTIEFADKVDIIQTMPLTAMITKNYHGGKSFKVYKIKRIISNKFSI